MRWNVFLLVLSAGCSCAFSTKVTLTNNGYDDVVVAINPHVPEDPDLIQALKADIIVANENPTFGNFPYTLQYGGCGLQGEYIHLTPEYIKSSEYLSDTGPRGKVMVHEWAHLRWGVFDEGPTHGYQSFYRTGSTVSATRCPESLQGQHFVLDYDSQGSHRQCEIDPTTMLPEAGCVFVPITPQPESGISSSIMSHQFWEEVTTFCHSNESDPVNLHNTAAPNEQNRLCDLRSTWDVILESEDFANDSNPAQAASIDTTPTISVVQPLPSRFALVMDVSGSMATNDRITVMQRAAGLFVTDFVSDSSYVGLVSFSTTASQLSPLLAMNESSRNALQEIISNTKVDHTTGIGHGIQLGLEVLKGPSQQFPGGGTLIVLTDGEENESPYVQDVYDEVIQSGARLCTIFLDLTTSSANAILSQLSLETCGDWFLSSSSSTSTEILTNFQTLSQNDNGDVADQTYQIHTSAYTLASEDSTGETATGSLSIDSTIGTHTLFTFIWSSVQPEISVSSPWGCDYTNTGSSTNPCPDDPIHACDDAQKSCKFTVPGIAAIGQWNYMISNIDGASQDVTVSVTSRPSSSAVSLIVVESYIGSSDYTTLAPAAVYATVSEGFSPVLGADVTAVITAPISGYENILELYDNGAGPDLRLNDGIYSRYFQNFTEQGRYSFRVEVNGQLYGFGLSAGSPAAFNPGTLFANGTLVPNPNGLSNVPNTDTTNTSANATGEEFERVTSGGSFSYTGPTIAPGSDVFGPNRITDLAITLVNSSDTGDSVFLQATFTAPGDDLDVGYASVYQIRYTNSSSSTLLNDFNSGALITQDNVVQGNISSPQEALQTETLVLKISFNGDNGTQFFIGISAFDDVGQTSGVSNIASVVIARSLDPTDDTTKEEDLTSSIPDDGQGPDVALIIGLTVSVGTIVLIGVAYALYNAFHSKKVMDGTHSAYTDHRMTPVEC